MSALAQTTKDLAAVLEKFRSERTQLDGHIKALESLVGALKGDAPVKRGPGRPKGSGKKPGRPPKAAVEAKPVPPKAPRKRSKAEEKPAKTQEVASASEGDRKKPNWSEESRRQAAERARKMWEARRKKKQG
ncbi:MAG: hypothetical protein HY791_18150 [Deltaproteobacteria bacterium]|nr:hypothetical protein [Deltaproteobacteria bacterium]